MELTRPGHPLITYGTYPAVALATVAAVTVTLRVGLTQDLVVVLLTLFTIIVAALIEWRHPLQDQWRMTKRSFVNRDLPFLGLGLVVARIAEAVGVLLVARLVTAAGYGPLVALPVGVQAVVALLVFDLLWYGYHRVAHAGGRLWRVHGAHHAPSQVYVLMHPVFHPFDLVVSRLVIVVLAFRLTGVAPDAIFIAVVILNLQQTISHVNADLRVGPLNYLLIGTETHRFHHSANDHGNFGSVIAVWDLIFGTFIYRPTKVPERLGLTDPTTYPNPERFHDTLAWPLRRSLIPVDTYQ